MRDANLSNDLFFKMLSVADAEGKDLLLISLCRGLGVISHANVFLNGLVI